MKHYTLYKADTTTDESIEDVLSLFILPSQFSNCSVVVQEYNYEQTKAETVLHSSIYSYVEALGFEMTHSLQSYLNELGEEYAKDVAEREARFRLSKSKEL